MSRPGQNLIELILALALFFIFIAGGLLLTSRYLSTFDRSQDLNKIQPIVSETFEAIQNIAYDNWSGLIDGDHGLTISSNKWILQSSPDIIDNKFTRTVTIAPVSRDTSCQIVAIGGTTDPDTKLVTATITRQTDKGPFTQIFSKYYTNWSNPTPCEPRYGEAGQLTLDVSNANIDSTKKSLVNARFINTGTVPITLDKMTLTWTESGNITYIKINGYNHWHSTNGIGTPQGDQPSGTELDLVDFVMQPGQTYPIDSFRFDSKVDGSTFVITCTMKDKTKTTVITTPPFVP